MTDIENTTVVVTPRRNRLWASAAAIAVAAALGGVLIGRSCTPATLVNVTAQKASEKAEGGEEGEEHGPEGFVAMTPSRIAAGGIQTTEVAEGTLASEIIVQATVTAPPDGRAIVTARADGAVVRINKRLGDAVRTGEVVAILESREASTFVAERNAAAARALAARSAAARERRLFSQRITARQDLEAAVAASAQAEAELQRATAAVRTAGVIGNSNLAVRSPINGRITEVDAQLGAYVSAGAELFNIADPSRIQIEAAVPAVEAQRLRAGDRATIELPDGTTVDGVVRSTTAVVNQENRSATIVIQPLGAPAMLPQGQAVRVRIVPQGTATAGAIVLPEAAVQQVGGRDVVFMRTEGGFQATPVTVANRTAGRVQISEGLRRGMVVVTTGAFALKSELGASEAEH